MEQENQSVLKPEGAGADEASVQTDTESSAPQADTGESGEQENFARLMESSAMLSPFAGWLKCLRKPAISVEYNLKKRHVPDLDQDGGQSKQSGQGTQNGSGKDRQGSCGKNSDVMGVSGSFTIRYFDFALGILGLAIVKCMAKGCRCLGRWMD